MKTPLQIFLVFLFAEVSKEIVFTNKAPRLLSSPQAGRPGPVHDRKLFLVTQSTIDANNYSIRNQCTCSN